jgi:hypothetical protein
LVPQPLPAPDDDGCGTLSELAPHQSLSCPEAVPTNSTEAGKIVFSLKGLFHRIENITISNPWFSGKRGNNVFQKSSSLLFHPSALGLSG